MPSSLSLNGDWSLSWNDDFPQYLTALDCPARGKLTARVHATLMRHGLLDDPRIAMTRAEGKLTLRSDVFVWDVCLDIDGEKPLSDNCFDLLPGVSYTIPWDEAVLGEPRIIRTGNDLLRPET